MIVAGHETTAFTLFWAIFVLALTPHLQARVAKEASEVDLGPDAAGDAEAVCLLPALSSAKPLNSILRHSSSRGAP